MSFGETGGRARGVSSGLGVVSGVRGKDGGVSVGLEESCNMDEDCHHLIVAEDVRLALGMSREARKLDNFCPTKKKICYIFITPPFPMVCINHDVDL